MAELFKIGYAWRIARELEKEKLKLNAAPDPQEGEFKGIATLTALLAKCVQWSNCESYRVMRAIDKRTANASVNEAAAAFISHLMAVAK
jgi:hypothetical protein